MQYIPHLISEMKNLFSGTDNMYKQYDFINSVDNFMELCAIVSKCAKANIPTIIDQASALHLNNTVIQLNSSLSNLKPIVLHAKEIYTGLEFNATEEILKNLQVEIHDYYNASENYPIRPLPGETTDSTSFKLGSVAKSIEFAAFQWICALNQNNETHTKNSMRKFLVHIKELVHIARAIVATNSEKEIQINILNYTEEVIKLSIQLCQQSKLYFVENEPATKIIVEETFEKIISSLDSCVSCLPEQRELNQVIDHIRDLINTLDRNDTALYPQDYE